MKHSELSSAKWGHYRHYTDFERPSNVDENNGNSLAVNSEVTPDYARDYCSIVVSDYTYDTPCEVKIDPTNAKMFR